MISNFFLNNIWAIHIVHFVFAVVLFFIVNWIGRNSYSSGYVQMSIVIQEDSAPAFNFLFKVLAPTVYLILCILLFQSVNIDVLVHKCYFIVIYYWAFRLMWNLLSNRYQLINWIEQILYWAASIGLSFWIYDKIKDIKSILPSGEEIIGEMWILIIAYLYAVINKLNIGRYSTIRRKEQYINSRYKKFRAKYNSIIHERLNNNFYESLIYTIMIYEDFNRPFFIRVIEDLRFFATKKKHTLGIMQVATEQYINDRQSVELAIDKVIRDNNEYIRRRMANSEDNEGHQISKYEIIYHIANQYNGGDPNYSYEISEIFDKIFETYYGGQLPDTFTTLPAHSQN